MKGRPRSPARGKGAKGNDETDMFQSSRDLTRVVEALNAKADAEDARASQINETDLIRKVGVTLLKGTMSKASYLPDTLRKWDKNGKVRPACSHPILRRRCLQL